MTLAKNIRYLRKKQGLSQEYIADALGYKSYTTIQKWEDGTSEPSLATLKKLAKIFGVSMDSLINYDYEKNEMERDGYYMDPEAAAIAQELYERPELKILFDASRKVTAEDLRIVQAMVDRMIKEEFGDGEDD